MGIVVLFALIMRFLCKVLVFLVQSRLFVLEIEDKKDNIKNVVGNLVGSILRVSRYFADEKVYSEIISCSVLII